MNDFDRELRRKLRGWDPVERLGDPDPATVAMVRARLLEAARRRPRVLPLLAVAALAAASLTVLFLLPARPVAPTVAEVRPVTVQFTASNGVRIHWSVYPEAEAERGRPARKRGTP